MSESVGVVFYMLKVSGECVRGARRNQLCCRMWLMYLGRLNLAQC